MDLVKGVDHVDPASLPAGRLVRLLVDIVEDGMGMPIRIPVLAMRGRRDGPVMGLTAALHGNELNGIPVIHRVFEGIDPGALRGTLVAPLVVNVPGFLMHQRFFNDERDLNHLFPGRADGNMSAVYTHRFLERIVRPMDQLIDLHTASFGRVNSLYVRADMTNAVTARMAYLQRPQIIVHNPPSDHTLRGAAQELGIPAITLEIGNPQRFHGDYIRRSQRGVRAVLADLGMVRKRPVSLGEPPVLCARSYWIYADRGGLLQVVPPVAQHVAQGEVIARLSDIFGAPRAEYRAPEAGVIVGRSVNPVAQTGARILHLGIPARDGDVPLLQRD